MIRRPPSVWPGRLRWALGPLVASAAIASLLLVASLGPGSRPKADAHGRPSPVRRPPPAPTVAKVFHAVGGPVTATVTVTGASGCRVDLVGADGSVLAGGTVAGYPGAGGTVTLHALAVAGAPISLMLHPAHSTGLSWEADLNGVWG